MKIIAFSGKRGSLTSEAASIVAKELKFSRLAFDTQLRHEIYSLGFNFGAVNKYCEIGDPFWNLAKAMRDARRFEDKGYWLVRLFRIIGEAKRRGIAGIVIDDLRYWNEAEQLRASGATLVRVSLTDPLFRQQFIPGVDDDKSETDLDQWLDWDFEIHAKKGDPAGLEAQVENIVQSVMSGEAAS